MYYEYDLMFRYLLASLAVPASCRQLEQGDFNWYKAFRYFAGPGAHRWLQIALRLGYYCIWLSIAGMPCVHQRLCTGGGITACYLRGWAVPLGTTLRQVLPKFPPLQMRTLTPTWRWKLACKLLILLSWLSLLSFVTLILMYSVDVDCLVFNLFYRLKSDSKTAKDVDLLGTGFQQVIDTYFWYLPFASVRQWKCVMDRAGIAPDEWMAKHADLSEELEHKTPAWCARKSLKQGLEHWFATDLFK
jgi:hypothetical protein